MESAYPLAAFSLLLALLSSLWPMAARAEGDPAPTYQRERQMQKYKGCHWTDEMGQYIYACIKKNDGFGTHWCYDETLEVFCPPQLEAAKKTADPATPDKPAN
ncbi:MAG: hypothetical protein C5B46_09330 [Proteobacteria bacterium]|nr:MAG: hypothetical protein C5B46_09330 [Pseudomonadota bacterium]